MVDTVIIPHLHTHELHTGSCDWQITHHKWIRNNTPSPASKTEDIASSADEDIYSLQKEFSIPTHARYVYMNISIDVGNYGQPCIA